MTDLQKLENFLQMNLPFAIGRMVRYYKDKDSLSVVDIQRYFSKESNLKYNRIHLKTITRSINGKAINVGWLDERILQDSYKELVIKEAIRLYRAGTYKK